MSAGCHSGRTPTLGNHFRSPPSADSSLQLLPTDEVTERTLNGDRVVKRALRHHTARIPRAPHPVPRIQRTTDVPPDDAPEGTEAEVASVIHGHGCKFCAGSAVDQRDAARIMAASGFAPLTPYPGSLAPWPFRCAERGRESTPRFASVRALGTRGKFCATRGVNLTEARARFRSQQGTKAEDPWQFRRRTDPDARITIGENRPRLPEYCEGRPRVARSPLRLTRRLQIPVH